MLAFLPWRHWLNDDLARRIANRNRLRRAAGHVDDGDIIRTFVGHVRGFAIFGGSRPVWLFADANVSSRLVHRRIKQGQFARSLHHDNAQSRAAWMTNEMR